MAARTFQVTIPTGGGPIQIATSMLPTGANPLARQIVFQNNAGHAIRVGDKNTTSSVGINLAASGAANSMVKFGPLEDPIDITTFWVQGTAADVLDVVYID